MHAVWFPKSRQTVQVVHCREVIAGVVGGEVTKLDHEALQGFKQVLAHGIPTGVAAATATTESGFHSYHIY